MDCKKYISWFNIKFLESSDCTVAIPVGGDGLGDRRRISLEYSFCIHWEVG